MTLQGKTAVVTGGATGIGQAIVLRLASDGVEVVIGDIQAAAETVRLVRNAGGVAHDLPCDVADEESVRQFAAQATALSGGPVDILVNNAGINGEAQLVRAMPLERWQRTLQVNLTGTMLVTRELIPALVASGSGRIVNVASNVGRRGLPFRADYVCSKWAVLGLTQTLALELATDGIRVNAVCPGPVEGDRIEQVMAMHADAEGISPQAIRERWTAETPTKRFVEPSEVAATVAFLCSDESSALTGQALNVAGGLIMT